MNGLFEYGKLKDAECVRVYRNELKSWNGEVSLQATHSDHPETDPIEKGFLWQEARFDSEGRVVEAKQYFPDGKLQHGIAQTYDSQGRLVNREETGEDCPLPVKTIITYDDVEKLHLRIQYFDKEVHEKEFVWHDAAGRPVKTEVHDWENTVQSVTERAYDEKGNLLSFRQCDGSGNEMVRIGYEYDENGLLVKETEYTEDQALVRNHIYKEGRLFAETWSSDGFDFVQKYGYDSKGNRILTVKYVGPLEADVRDTIFDDSGNVIRRIDDGGISALYVEKLSYDAENRVVGSVENIAEHGVIVKMQRSHDEKGRPSEMLHIYSSSGRYSSGGESYYLFYEYE